MPPRRLSPAQGSHQTAPVTFTFAAPGHRAEREAAARAGALLLTVVAVAVFLRGQRQVAARIHLHARRHADALAA